MSWENVFRLWKELQPEDKGEDQRKRKIKEG